jgi:MvdD family ATP-grasp ribosomal peptide maturase
MSVLIITRSDDNESVRMVAQAIERKGGEAIRFDTDCYPTDVRLSACYDKDEERLTLTNDVGEFDLREVTAIWHRRLNFGGGLPLTLDKQLRDASLTETRAAAMGMLASLKAFRMDAVEHIRRAENKQLQLQVARSLGLEIPRTLTTNDPTVVQAFARSCRSGIVTKMLSSFAVYEEGRELVVFTNAVKPEDLMDLSGLRLCPVTFQEMIPKALELRTTVVGRRVMSASINSQASQRAAHDWRRDGLSLIQGWQPYELPREVEEKILRLMGHFVLNYGAIDIIVTPDGRHVFLEINPVGEFFWLERYTGLPIAEAIADVLLSRPQNSAVR